MNEQEESLSQQLEDINKELATIKYDYNVRIEEFESEINKERIKINSKILAIFSYFTFAFIVYTSPILACCILLFKNMAKFKDNKWLIIKIVLFWTCTLSVKSLSCAIVVLLGIINSLKYFLNAKKNDEIKSKIEQLTNEKAQFSLNSELALKLNELNRQKRTMEEVLGEKKIEQRLKVEEMSAKFRKEREEEQRAEIENRKNAIEKAKQEQKERINAKFEQLQNDIRTITPEIIKFVQLNLIKGRKFPKLYEFKDEYIAALQQFLIETTGINIETERLKKLTDKEYTEQILCIFEKSFFEFNPKLPTSNITDWIKAYINTFELSENYLYEFEKILDRNNIQFDETIKNLIAKEVETIKKDVLVAKISQSMNNNVSLATDTCYSIDDIDEMNGIEFEQFLVKLFGEMKYKTIITQASRDQGADLIIENFNGKTIVQAKRYTGNVPNSAIQQAVAAISHYGCNNAMVVTNSYFTESAKELAQSNNVELWDRTHLCKVLDFYRVPLGN